MNINYRLEDGAYAPLHGHKADAGFDLRLPDYIGQVTVLPRHDVTINTGVHFEIPNGFVGFIKSKSGLNVNYGIQSEGVVDSEYTGTVVVKLYNLSDTPVVFNPGEKITQVVFLPIPEVELVEVDAFAETERGDSGFGSTGK